MALTFDIASRQHCGGSTFLVQVEILGALLKRGDPLLPYYSQA
jgi:hypothetical protein